MPLAQTSALKPGGNFSLLTGSLSAAVGIGNEGTGANFEATSLFGMPMAQKGTSSAFGASAANTADVDKIATIVDKTLRQPVCADIQTPTLFIFCTSDKAPDILQAKRLS
jgi:hypothetical protein